MESKSNESEKSRKTVTLILKTKRFEVEKQKLMNKSQYFAALLSANYLEYNQKEHIVNYNISPIILQNFINWIHYDKLYLSMTNNDFEEFDNLLLLLELSVLFAADKLEKVITDKLERNYMSPKYALNIWLLAQELNINTLRDISLDVCLDRFNLLPRSSIYELSKENFLKLIGNINIRSNRSYLCDIVREWNDHNDFTISLDIIKKHKQAKILHSIVSCENPSDINSEHFIHCWDGNDFFELTSFNYPQDITDRSTGENILEGMQIIGRRFDLYLCGGEFGNCSCMFNTNVWRYSLISKKWYFQTVMPVVRRDMIAVILKNKLLLVGGRGQNLKKLQSVDIYDIYTDTWTSGAEIPWKFTSIPEHSICNKNLIIHGRNCFFSYCPDEDEWKKVIIKKKFRDSLFPSENMPILALKTMPCYIDIVNPNKMILRTVTQTCNRKYCNCLIIERLALSMDDIRSCMTPTIFSIEYINDTEISILTVDKLCRTEYQTVLMCMDLRYLVNKLHLHSIHIQNPNKFRSFLSSNSPFSSSLPFRKFFYLIHPTNLHMTKLDI